MKTFCIIKNGFGRRADSKIKGLPLCSFDIWWRHSETERQPDHYRIDVTPENLIYKLTDNYEVSVDFNSDVTQFNLQTLKEAMINNVKGICGTERYYYVDDGDEIPICCDNDLHEALKYGIKRRENGSSNVIFIVDNAKRNNDEQLLIEKSSTEVFFMKFAVDKPEGALMLKGNFKEGLMKKVLDLVQKETSGMVEICNTSSFCESDRALASLKKYIDEMKEQITADVTDSLLRKFEKNFKTSEIKSEKCVDTMENELENALEQVIDVKSDSNSTETDKQPSPNGQTDDKIKSKDNIDEQPRLQSCYDKSTSTQSNFSTSFNFRPKSQDNTIDFKTFRFSNDPQIDKNLSWSSSMTNSLVSCTDTTKTNSSETKEPEKSTNSSIENPVPSTSSENITKDVSDKEKGTPSDSEFEIISKENIFHSPCKQFTLTATPPFLFTGNVSSQNTTNRSNAPSNGKQVNAGILGNYRNLLAAKRRTSHSKF